MSIWEHPLRDQDDFNKHVDYIHWNPVKHGWVKQVADWPHSSFHDYAARGIYPVNWGCEGIFDVARVNNSNDALRSSAHPTRALVF